MRKLMAPAKPRGMAMARRPARLALARLTAKPRWRALLADSSVYLEPRAYKPPQLMARLSKPTRASASRISVPHENHHVAQFNFCELIGERDAARSVPAWLVLADYARLLRTPRRAILAGVPW